MICKRCKVEMKEGIALINNVSAGMPDFAGMDANSTGQTVSYDGTAEMNSVLKCPECGASASV